MRVTALCRVVMLHPETTLEVRIGGGTHRTGCTADAYYIASSAVPTGYWSRANQMDFGSVKFSSAASPCSRPKPDSPDPPHGKRTSV
jgi:hypothetical protein